VIYFTQYRFNYIASSKLFQAGYFNCNYEPGNVLVYAHDISAGIKHDAAPKSQVAMLSGERNTMQGIRCSV
jgi:hypothetical protein